MARPRKILPEHAGETIAEISEKSGASKQAVRKSGLIGRPPQKIDVEASKNGFETLLQVQLRKERALADLHEIKSLREQGKVIEFEPLKQAFALFGQTLRDHMMAIPDRVAGELAALTDARMVRDRLLDEIRTVLKNLPDVFSELTISKRSTSG